MFGLTFDSKTEAQRYAQLKHQLDIGVISDLRLQVQFEIIPKLISREEITLKTKTKTIERIAERAAHYTADFVYTNSSGQTVIEEVKSKGTMLARDYPLRRKLIRKKIAEMNEKEGFEKYTFSEIIT